MGWRASILRLGLLLVFTFATALASSARAADATISSTIVGGYNALGGYDNTFAFQNYFTGTTATGPQPDRRSFYVFTLPPSPPVVSASLIIRNPFLPSPGGGGTPGYFSDDPFEMFRLSDTPFPIAAILAPHTVPEATSIWATLGSGTLFGSTAVTPAPGPLDDLTIPLTGAALGYINAHLGGGIVMGGQVSTLDGTSADELIFAYSDIPSPHMTEPRLALTFIPEPGATGLLLGAALTALSRRHSRRRR